MCVCTVYLNTVVADEMWKAHLVCINSATARRASVCGWKAVHACAGG